MPTRWIAKRRSSRSLCVSGMCSESVGWLMVGTVPGRASWRAADLGDNPQLRTKDATLPDWVLSRRRAGDDPPPCSAAVADGGEPRRRPAAETLDHRALDARGV